jgi:hypothetical protein
MSSTYAENHFWYGSCHSFAPVCLKNSTEGKGIPANVTCSPVLWIYRAWGELVGPEGRCRLANLPTPIHLRDCKIVLKGKKKEGRGAKNAV